MRGRTRQALGVVGALCAFVITFAAVALYAHVTDSGAPAASIGSEPIVARPAPAVLPEPVAATGACAAAMEAVRAIQHRFASGSVLDQTANEKLTAGLARLDRDCDSASAHAFRSRELTPWLTYLPPRAG